MTPDRPSNRLAPEQAPDGTPELDRLWRELLTDWENDERQQQFVAQCSVFGELPAAGRRYRQLRDGEPTRAARAQTQIDRIHALALQELQSMKTKGADAPRGKRILLTVAVVLLLTAAVLSIWAMLSIQSLRDRDAIYHSSCYPRSDECNSTSTPES